MGCHKDRGDGTKNSSMVTQNLKTIIYTNGSINIESTGVIRVVSPTKWQEGGRKFAVSSTIK